VEVGNLLFLSGQGADGHRGRVGADMTLDEGRSAAHDCMLNLLAQVDDALDGAWERFVRPVKVLGFVACTEDFHDTPKVIDGASEMLIEVFGDAGQHARSAIGAQSLPLGFAVEIEMVVEIVPRGRAGADG